MHEACRYKTNGTASEYKELIFPLTLRQILCLFMLFPGLALFDVLFKLKKLFRLEVRANHNPQFVKPRTITEYGIKRHERYTIPLGWLLSFSVIIDKKSRHIMNGMSSWSFMQL